MAEEEKRSEEENEPRESLLNKTARWASSVRKWIKDNHMIVSSVAAAVAAVATCYIAFMFYFQTSAVRQQLALYLSVTRPFLSLQPFVNSKMNSFSTTAKNVGGIPARKVEEVSKIWANGEIPKTAVPYSDRTILNVIYPDDTIKLNFLENYESVKEEAISGRLCLEMAACVIYGSIDQNDTRRWKAVYHGYFDPSIGKESSFITIFSNDTSVSHNSARCEVGPPRGCGFTSGK